jgi:aconitate hydratase
LLVTPGSERVRATTERVAVIARSFARIHETNLERHGVLALTLDDPSVYDLVAEGARLSLLDLASLAPGRPVPGELRNPDGSIVPFTCHHTLDDEQRRWFLVGSSLNAARTGSAVA